MKRSLLLIFVLSLFATEFNWAAEPEGRPQLPLSGPWKMQLLGKNQNEPNGKWADKPLSVPGTSKLAKDKSALCLEREITIPNEWSSSRVVLHIGHPLFAAVVSVNGTMAGSIVASGGEVDISKLVHFGATNTLRLVFPRDGGSVLAGDKWASKMIASLPEDEKNQVGILGLPETIYLEKQQPDIQITDVWYRTFTRKSIRVEPLITVTAPKALSNVHAKVILYDAKNPEASVTTEFSLGSIPAGESTHTVTIPAANLKLWGLREPNLYRGQVVLIDPVGKELDRSNPVNFGIREFWIQGRDYYMNNQQIHFTFDAYLFSTLKQAFDAGVTLSFGKHADNGVSLTNDAEKWAQQSDELGMGFICYGASVGYKSPDLTNKENLASYRFWVESHLRNLRNHPSILFWVLSTNMGGGDIYKPTTIGRTSSLRKNHSPTAIPYEEHRRADDTRPSFHHQSAGTADLDAGNVYFNHLPMQAMEDWLSAWKAEGDRPYMYTEFMGTPLEADYAKGSILSYATEYAARLSGDRAYTEETDAYRDYSGHTVPRFVRVWSYNPLGYSPILMEQARTNIPRSYFNSRYYGVPADLWIFPGKAKDSRSENDPQVIAKKELVQIGTDVLKPVCFEIDGPANDWTSKAHLFYPGDTITKSVLVVSDQPWKNEITVKWEAKIVGGATLASGTEHASVEPWGRAALQFQFKAPDNTTAAPIPIEITAKVSGAKDLPETTCEPFRCTVWPRLAKPIPQGPVFSVLDPEGDTTKWLQKAGATVEPFDPSKPKPKILVIGRRGLQNLAKLPFSAEDIHRGMRVLICEQTCGDLEKMGFRVEDYCPRNVFARMVDHPILSGLSNDALRDWSGNATLLPWGPEGDTTHTPYSRRQYHWSNRGTVVSNMMETPHYGSFKAISDCEFDLSYTPLLSWQHGDGEVIFSQLDLTARTADDPAVDRLCRNVVGYFQSPKSAPAQNRIAICASVKTSELITALGFSAKAWEENANPATSVLVFGKEDAALWPKLRDQALAFANAGGTVLFFPASNGILSDPAFKGISLHPARIAKPETIIENDSLLTGVGLQNLHWRNPIDLSKIEGAPDSGFKSLIGGLAGKVPQGKGQFVFLQTDPSAFNDYTASVEDDARLRKPDEKPLPTMTIAKDRKRSVWQSNRLNALVLTNLGVESSPSLVKGLFEATVKMPFYLVDKWMLLGPIPPPSDPNADPMAADFTPLLANRVLEKPVTLATGESIPWYAPNDFNNGLGVGGMVDISKAYGAKLKQTALAVTYLWSSRERTATFQVGADWWLKVTLNGTEIFRTDSAIRSHSGLTHSTDFGFTVKGKLNKGWNEVVCAVGSGSGGNAFWFRVSNPGDMIEDQSIVPPKETPMMFLRLSAGGKFSKMSDEEMQQSEEAPDTFSLYTEPLTVKNDPYLYMRW